MIRPSDLAGSAGWITPTTGKPAAAPRSDAHDMSGWFDSGGATAAGVRISSDVPLSARGLSVEQHAGQVLAHLLGERDDTV